MFVYYSVSFFSWKGGRLFLGILAALFLMIKRQSVGPSQSFMLRWRNLLLCFTFIFVSCAGCGLLMQLCIFCCRIKSLMLPGAHKPTFLKSLTFCVADHDECSTSHHGCEYKCNNFHGSFFCSCDSGYALNNGNKTCSVMITRVLGATNLLQIARSMTV